MRDVCLANRGFREGKTTRKEREGEIVVQRKDIEASAQVTQLKTKSLGAGIRIPEY